VGHRVGIGVELGRVIAREGGVAERPFVVAGLLEVPSEQGCELLHPVAVQLFEDLSHLLVKSSPGAKQDRAVRRFLRQAVVEGELALGHPRRLSDEPGPLESS
jgi:hypothetical protein